MPELIDGRLELSAYGCHEMEPVDIWALNERTDRDPKGRAEYMRQQVDELDQVFFSPDPEPSLHGNIIGWPEGEDERDKVMEIAAELAEQSDYKPYPE